MKNLIQDTLNRIKKEHIAPEPRWKFLVRKFSAWAVLGLIVLLGAVSISVVFYLLSQLDWEMPGTMHQNAFVYGLSVFPYFWLILLGIFVAIAFFGVRETEAGYRFSWFKIISITIAGILLIGFFMSLIGFGGRFNGMMMQGVPYYARHMVTKETQWMQPENGFLAGTIGAVSGTTLEISDLNGRNWNVQLNDKTLVRPSVTLASGQMIKIIGTKKDAQNFAAFEIRPWIGQGMMGAGQGRGMMNNK